MKHRNSQAVEIVPLERVEQRILVIRNQRVLVDADLAELYGVPTKRLNQQVKRNAGRFPPDFVFQLTKKEKAEVVTNCNHLARLRYSPVLPYVFTEHGAIMAANVLNSDAAVLASVFVVRAFVRLRQTLATHRALAHKLSELERRMDHNDKSILGLVAAIRELMNPPAVPVKGRLGFQPPTKPNSAKKQRSMRK